jgi:hypothetical protein
VEEKKNDRDPTQENKLGEKFQEVIFNCLHDAEVVFQHILKWQDMLPQSYYHNFGERHQRTLKRNYSYVRRSGKKIRS